MCVSLMQSWSQVFIRQDASHKTVNYSHILIIAWLVVIARRQHIMSSFHHPPFMYAYDGYAEAGVDKNLGETFPLPWIHAVYSALGSPSALANGVCLSKLEQVCGVWWARQSDL